MTLPNLSPQQRAAALEKAAHARRVRADIKRELKAGKLSLEELLKRAESDEAIGKMRVITLLESMPRVGAKTAAQIMDQVGIAQSRRIRGLGIHQLNALSQRFAK